LVFLGLVCVAAFAGCGKSQGSLQSAEGQAMNISPGFTMTMSQENPKTGGFGIYIFRLDPPAKIEGARDISQIRQGQNIIVWYTEEDGVKYAKKIRVVR